MRSWLRETAQSCACSRGVLGLSGHRASCAPETGARVVCSMIPMGKTSLNIGKTGLSAPSQHAEADDEEAAGPVDAGLPARMVATCELSSPTHTQLKASCGHATSSGSHDESLHASGAAGGGLATYDTPQQAQPDWASLRAAQTSWQWCIRA